MSYSTTFCYTKINGRQFGLGHYWCSSAFSANPGIVSCQQSIYHSVQNYHRYRWFGFFYDPVMIFNAVFVLWFPYEIFLLKSVKTFFLVDIHWFEKFSRFFLWFSFSVRQLKDGFKWSLSTGLMRFCCYSGIYCSRKPKHRKGPVERGIRLVCRVEVLSDFLLSSSFWPPIATAAAQTRVSYNSVT